MRYWVGFDVGKAFHWVCVLDDEGEVVLSRRVEAEKPRHDVCDPWHDQRCRQRDRAFHAEFSRNAP